MKIPDGNDLDQSGSCPVALPRPGGVTTIYRAPEREPTLDVVGVSSTDVHNFPGVMHTFHTLDAASDDGLDAECQPSAGTFGFSPIAIHAQDKQGDPDLGAVQFES
jgi:hypothetical protein